MTAKLLINLTVRRGNGWNNLIWILNHSSYNTGVIYESELIAYLPGIILQNSMPSHKRVQVDGGFQHNLSLYKSVLRYVVMLGLFLRQWSGCIKNTD